MDLTDLIFQEDDLAREWLENQRWPDGPYCPHCGNSDQSKITSLRGKAHRPGLYKCNECREQFSVTVKTVMERSHIPLNKWVLAMFLMASSKKGISAHQMHRTMKLPYKTAWFLAHRIREAMRDDGAAGPLGGLGKIIEADETYWGPKDADKSAAMRARRKGKPGPGGKSKIVALVERGGRARSVHVENLDRETVQKFLFTNASRKSALMTDEANIYPSIGLHFARHEAVKHGAGEYVRGDATTNTVEGFFSIFKRGMRGVYQHCNEKHLHRYLAEFNFRYSQRIALGIDDAERAARLARSVENKRLMYRRPRSTKIDSGGSKAFHSLA